MILARQYFSHLFLSQIYAFSYNVIYSLVFFFYPQRQLLFVCVFLVFILTQFFIIYLLYTTIIRDLVSLFRCSLCEFNHNLVYNLISFSTKATSATFLFCFISFSLAWLILYFFKCFCVNTSMTIHSKGCFCEVVENKIDGWGCRRILVSLVKNEHRKYL